MENTPSPTTALMFLSMELTDAQFAADRITAGHGTRADVRQVMQVMGGAFESEPPLHFWGTTLGRMLAAAADFEPFADPDATWSHAESAEVLGIARGTVGTYAQGGYLPKAANGYLLRSGILRRLAMLAERAA